MFAMTSIHLFFFYSFFLKQNNCNNKDLRQRESNLRERLIVARQKADESRLALSGAQSKGQVLSSLLKQKESGRIKGICVCPLASLFFFFFKKTSFFYSGYSLFFFLV